MFQRIFGSEDHKLAEWDAYIAAGMAPERKQELQALDAVGLEQLVAKLRAERRWP